jgi:uncharacterized membrane protein YhdT
MQSLKRKLKEFNQRRYKRWELYIQLTFLWVATGAFLAGAVVLVDDSISKGYPVWLMVCIILGAIYMVFCFSYIGISFLKPYMDGIYQQYLKEHGERIAKVKDESNS